MIKNIKLLSIFAILALSAFLRIYDVWNFPPLNADEAALGYNALSILRTGMDEHGNRASLHLQSFNDYKPALLAYLMIPGINFFGLNEVTVRFIPVFLSITTVFMVYLLGKKIYGQEVGILSSFAIAVSPWHIHFSRGAWETSVATFFITSGVYFLLCGFENIKKTYIGIVLVSLSLYTYHSARLVVPILVVTIFLLNKKKYLVSRGKLFSYIFLFVLIGLPLAVNVLGPSVFSRAQGVSIFANRGPIDRVNELRGHYNNPSSLIVKLLNTKEEQYALWFLKNWASHFSGDFLFISGDDIQRNKVPETGLLYLHESILVILGVIFTLKSQKKLTYLVFAWALVSPIPAALTFQSPHALRSSSMSVPLSLLVGSGIYYIFNTLEKHKKLLRQFGLLFIVSVYAFFVTRYLHQYYLHTEKAYLYSSQYGLKELADFVLSEYKSHEKVIITDRYDQPYILLLFYGSQKGKEDFLPEEFQFKHSLTGRDNYGFSTVREYKNIRFESINYEEMRNIYKDSLLIGTPSEIPVEANVIKNIYGQNGELYFRVVAN